MIDIRKLKELVRLMVVNELTEIDLRDSEEQVTLRRHSLSGQPVLVPAAHGVSAAPAAPARAPVRELASGAAGEASDDDQYHRIVSPMVGTFYAAGNPDSPAFVSVGSAVGPDSTVCIVEAMKLFNEIKAECSGVIHRVLVGNGQSVEYGQPLFLVAPT